jgi:hypothetical protein
MALAPHKSELRCHILKSTHAYLRTLAANSHNISTVIDELARSHKHQGLVLMKLDRVEEKLDQLLEDDDE